MQKAHALWPYERGSLYPYEHSTFAMATVLVHESLASRTYVHMEYEVKSRNTTATDGE